MTRAVRWPERRRRTRVAPVGPDGAGGDDRPAGRSTTSRLMLSILSQGLSSATNLAATILLVAIADQVELGRWVAVTSIYLLALTVLRSSVLEPMVTATHRPSST